MDVFQLSASVHQVHPRLRLAQMGHVEARKDTHASSRDLEIVVRHMGGADRVQTIVPADVEVHLDLATASAHRVVHQHCGHLPASEVLRPRPGFLRQHAYQQAVLEQFPHRSQVNGLLRVTHGHYRLPFKPRARQEDPRQFHLHIHHACQA